jgi:hypothetical protein
VVASCDAACGFMGVRVGSSAKVSTQDGHCQ